MTTYERVKFFTDKEEGFGVSIGTLAAASGYKRTTLSHYLAQDRKITARQENAWERGMQKIATAMYNFVYDTKE